MNNGTTFGDGFAWGVASSAYQIEGAARNGGRGLSVWDIFCRRPGAIYEGHTGDVACDHYRRFEQDIDLMKRLGVQMYRFSIAWPRLLPDGVGRINEEGLAFYDRLIDALLARGIEPWVTLFHWDFPQELFERGGWLSPDSPHWFAEYSALAVDRYSDRVTNWITLNEPQIYLGLGHHRTIHAPGISYARADILRATHHTLLAHGRAVQVIRTRSRRTARIGWSPSVRVAYPMPEIPALRELARAATFSISPDPQAWPLNNIWYADAIVFGRYPEEHALRFGSDMPKIGADDMQIISQPTDFMGVNIYHGEPIMSEDHPAVMIEDESPDHHVIDEHRTPGHPQTMMGWTIDPEVLYWGPRFLFERYRLPIFVTENGIASMDWIHADGRVHDAPRIDYLCRHLWHLRRARSDGVDVRGYFQWSIMDNFEWERGYSKRFGLIYVNYRTMERIPKDSFHWYRDVIASNGGCLPQDLAPAQ